MNRYKYTDEKKAHLHTLDDKPLIGTSTACKIIAKPLTWWAAGMALKSLGWANKKLGREELLKAAEEGLKRIAHLTEPEPWANFLQECYCAHDTSKKEAGVAGTDMHADLERYVKECIEKHDGKPFIAGPDFQPKTITFSIWATTNVHRFLWSEAHCYSDRLWVGGISDAGAQMNDSKLAVIDFKSSKDAYYDQYVQAAGYALQIEEHGLFDPNGNAIEVLPIYHFDVLYVVPFGAEDPTPQPHFDVEGRKADFEAAVRLYKSSQIFANN